MTKPARPAPLAPKGPGSSPGRRGFLLGALAGTLTLPACRFAPAYGPGGAGEVLQGQVALPAPTNRNEFDLTGRLEERLGRVGSGAPYRLAYRLSVTPEGLGITPEATITRYHLKGVLDWTLSDAGGQRRAGGRVQNFTAYAATGSTVAGLAAEEDAARRLMRILADQLTTALIAAAGRGAL